MFIINLYRLFNWCSSNLVMYKRYTPNLDDLNIILVIESKLQNVRVLRFDKFIMHIWCTVDLKPMCACAGDN